MSLKDPNVVNPKKKKRVAIVIANPAISTTTQWPVGFWWSELTHPYYVMAEAGYEVEIFSPQGGKCEADGMSDPRDASGYSASDLISMGFIATPKLAALIENTRPVTEMDVKACLPVSPSPGLCRGSDAGCRLALTPFSALNKTTKLASRPGAQSPAFA